VAGPLLDLVGPVQAPVTQPSSGARAGLALVPLQPGPGPCPLVVALLVSEVRHSPGHRELTSEETMDPTLGKAREDSPSPDLEGSNLHILGVWGEEDSLHQEVMVVLEEGVSVHRALMDRMWEEAAS